LVFRLLLQQKLPQICITQSFATLVSCLAQLGLHRSASNRLFVIFQLFNDVVPPPVVLPVTLRSTVARRCRLLEGTYSKLTHSPSLYAQRSPFVLLPSPPVRRLVLSACFGGVPRLPRLSIAPSDLRRLLRTWRPYLHHVLRYSRSCCAWYASLRRLWMSLCLSFPSYIVS
jgi:hypothetical protein